MTQSIITTSREFFRQAVKPLLEREFPEETARTAFGIFGYGSEALRLDDKFSRDHHWGIRIDAMMPPDVFDKRKDAILAFLSKNLPASFQGHSLREGHLSGSGLAPDNLRAFLLRTIGIDHAPETSKEWLDAPEEDIIHVINGEIWHDPDGRFTAVREAFQKYYPDPVWKRRLAHWCRYFSGMGVYALHRAVLRKNELYAAIAFGKAIRWGIQIAFLLEKRYFPYDKWLMTMFERLPRLAAPLTPIVVEAVRVSTSWDRKLELLNQMSDILDETMVKDGLIKPHPKYKAHPTSGYRLLEHAYAEIIKGLPAEIKTSIPLWDQIYLEQFHSGYVDSLDMEHWDKLLNLES